MCRSGTCASQFTSQQEKTWFQFVVNKKQLESAPSCQPLFSEQSYPLRCGFRIIKEILNLLSGMKGRNCSAEKHITGRFKQEKKPHLAISKKIFPKLIFPNAISKTYFFIFNNVFRTDTNHMKVTVDVHTNPLFLCIHFSQTYTFSYCIM